VSCHDAQVRVASAYAADARRWQHLLARCARSPGGCEAGGRARTRAREVCEESVRKSGLRRMPAPASKPTYAHTVPPPGLIFSRSIFTRRKTAMCIRVHGGLQIYR
jgi:hypothetical protein